MPYARRSYKKRYRKRNYRRSQSTAQKALALAKKAYKMPELKYNSLVSSPQVADPSAQNWLYLSLAETSQGLTNNTRIGDSIHPTSLHFRFTPTTSCNRFIIFRWISEAPSFSTNEILESVNDQSFKSEDKRFQSEILYDWTPSRYAESNILLIKKKIKLNKLIAYSQGTTTPNRSGIYVMFITNNTVSTTPFNMGEWNSRLYYKDP